MLYSDIYNKKLWHTLDSYDFQLFSYIKKYPLK
jgi:hypothetical protein